MFTIRKAKIKHTCLVCNNQVKPKERYISFNKQNIDGTYTTGAICKTCMDEILTSAIKNE